MKPWEPELDDDLLPEEDETVEPSTLRVPWKVLLVDDDPDVLLVSRLALRPLRVDNRPVRLLQAENAAGARRILSEHDDISVALIDVIMESPLAGLELVDWIRRDLGNWSTRLIVRTGQPGSAPEARLMSDYDLHDYIAKTESTVRRLTTSITGAIRAWRDQRMIARQQGDLEQVLAALRSQLGTSSSREALGRSLEQMTNLVEPPLKMCAYGRQHGRWEWLATSGGEPPDALGPETQSDIVIRIPTDTQGEFVLWARRDGLSDWERQLLRIYCQASVVAVERALVWEAALEQSNRSLNEREVMLKEIHHRVKNNLQITASLLSLQSAGSGDPALISALQDSSSRIRAMALVHQQLYAGQDLAELEFDHFTSNLVALIAGTLGRRHELCYALEPVALSIDVAIPLGLVLNELVTNAFKHGVSQDGSVRLEVMVTRQADGRAELVVADKGPGLSEGPKTTSLGLRMVRLLVKQVKGDLRIENDEGAKFTVTFDPGLTKDQG